MPDLEARRDQSRRNALDPIIRTACSRAIFTIFRCPACQTAVWSEYGGAAKLRFVRVGTLDQPAVVMPDVHIYVRSKLP
jgi:hypothetical protein